jgi:Sulfotransferase family/Aspartyl/Asparaginyl beta-hydroxylase
MRLPKPFYRLPVRFDVARLREELAAFPPDAWAPHPNAIPGNSSVRLISAGGGENDDVNGVMMPTAHLQRSPFLRQVLASFGVVWSRSRLLRLAPEAGVPEHADINYHWHNRVRLHIPIITRKEVRFFCGGDSVHMAAGEAWLFDNWRLHRVENPTPDERIHLVADTSGSSNFWQFVADGDAGAIPTREVRYDGVVDRAPLMERTVLAPVMSPAEVDLLALDMRAELVVIADTPEQRGRLTRYHALLDSLCRDWRQLYALYGAEPAGWPEFVGLRDKVRTTSRALAEGLVMRTNGVEAHRVLEARLLRAMLSFPDDASAPGSTPPQAMSHTSPVRMSSPASPPQTSSPSPAPQTSWRSPPPRTGPVPSDGARLDRPLFIVAAPRSGSTLLFETLAVSPELFTLGGEAHALVEGVPALRPGAPGVSSNRLTAEHATADIARRIVDDVLEGLRGARGERPPPAGPLRFLEKTPKNVLRIPFFDRIFPDARYIFLWRDPRENLSSIIEAWKSGLWKTYSGLPGFDGPWSLLLPPGWETFNGRPLEEIAAFQWESANRFALDDLARLPAHRWCVVTYEGLCREPAATVRRLCDFAGIDFGGPLAQHVSRPLPVSRFTLTPPAAGKWRGSEALIERVLPATQVTWNRLRALG